MRIETVYNVKRPEAIKRMPWAEKIVAVHGGYKGFESTSDYKTWKAQK